MIKKQLSIFVMGVSLSIVAIFTIASFAGYGIADIEGISVSLQPSKMVFVENVATTALFEFRDGSEMVPIQQFSQTGGYGTTTLSSGTAKSKSQESSETTGRSKPSFTMEKLVGGTPYLYAAADETQKYFASSGFEYDYKFFDVTVYLARDGDVLRSFEYRDCQITNYNVVTRSDNEEGYTGKGFVLVDQFSFECKGYTPMNPAMEQLKLSETPNATKTISSTDLRNTDQWAPEFTK
jgi:hypothetical protein